MKTQHKTARGPLSPVLRTGKSLGARLSVLSFMLCCALSAQAEKAETPQPNALEKFFPFIILGFLFYFLLIRPQQKRRKQKEVFLSQLKRGDEVLTAGGIYGKITGLSADFITLEVGKNVQIRALKSQISPYTATAPEDHKSAKEKNRKTSK